MSKSEALRQLAKKRCEYKIPEYSQPEDFPAGPKKYCFHEFVSPYSKGAFNINSPFMFVLQDWSSADALRTYVECCRGVSPAQAVKSRPFLNISAGSASVAKVIAVIGPTPGSC